MFESMPTTVTPPNLKSNPLFCSILTEPLNKLSKIFESSDYTLKICGGAVRDILLGIKPQDIDFATDATPDEMVNLFNQHGLRMINNNGLKHGTVTVRIDNKENFEVTTLRVDDVCDGRHAQVKFVKDWKLDANRRDLTINSLFLGLNGAIQDYFGGVSDLQQRKVRFVGDASLRIKEDYLRILRFFRYLGRISDCPHEESASTINVIEPLAAGLDGISAERKWLELSRILKGKNAPEIVKLMLESKALLHVGLPQPVCIDKFAAIYQESIDLNPDIGVLLCALLPADITEGYQLDQMKLPKATVSIVTFINKNIGEFEKLTGVDEKIVYLEKLMINSSPNAPLTSQLCTEICKYAGDKETLERFDPKIVKRLPVSGLEIIDKCLITNKKVVSGLIRRLNKSWVESRYTMAKGDILALAQKLCE